MRNILPFCSELSYAIVSYKPNSWEKSGSCGRNWKRGLGCRVVVPAAGLLLMLLLFRLLLLSEATVGRGGGGGRPGEVMGAARRLGSRGRGGPGCVGEGGLGGNPSKNAGPLRGLPPGPVLLFCPSNSCLIVRGTIWP